MATLSRGFVFGMLTAIGLAGCGKTTITSKRSLAHDLASRKPSEETSQEDDNDALSATQGVSWNDYRPPRRVVGAGLKGSLKGVKVTGRLSMGKRDDLQCEAAYSNDERVKGKWIVGVNNAMFGTGQNGQITDACGKIVRITFNGREFPYDFIVVDRIWESEAQNQPSFDVAVEAYYKLREFYGVNDNLYNATIKVLRHESYKYKKQPGQPQGLDCFYQPRNAASKNCNK